jgi:predicted nuclease of predicted toxin-antitoxin system
VRFLADESCDASVVRALRAAGHDVKAVIETARGATDRAVLALALIERRLLLTRDKDFGELVFAARAPASGVLLLRYPPSARSSLAKAVLEAVTVRPLDLTGSFVVIGPAGVRVTPLPTE